VSTNGADTVASSWCMAIVVGGFAAAARAQVNWRPALLSARHGHAMAYDVARGKVVLFGGWGSVVYQDTWEWDGIGWSQLHPVHRPPARKGHAQLSAGIFAWREHAMPI
jgi:hypothetical protein